MTDNAPLIVFLRHGQPRGGEHDPELTSAGHRMAAEAAAWITRLNLPLERVIHTPTARTRQTAEAAAEALGLPLAALMAEPLDDSAWEALLSSQRPAPRFGDRSLPRPPAPPFWIASAMNRCSSSASTFPGAVLAAPKRPRTDIATSRHNQRRSRRNLTKA